jgi:hypothetical protein
LQHHPHQNQPQLLKYQCSRWTMREFIASFTPL